MTETEAPPVQEYRLDLGDAERFAHIIHAPGRDAGALITEARVWGTPVTALCRKTWVPTRDPKRFPLCPECREKAERLGMEPTR